MSETRKIPEDLEARKKYVYNVIADVLESGVQDRKLELKKNAQNSKVNKALVAEHLRHVPEYMPHSSEYSDLIKPDNNHKYIVEKDDEGITGLKIEAHGGKIANDIENVESLLLKKHGRTSSEIKEVINGLDTKDSGFKFSENSSAKGGFFDSRIKLPDEVIMNGDFLQFISEVEEKTTAKRIADHRVDVKEAKELITEVPLVNNAGNIINPEQTIKALAQVEDSIEKIYAKLEKQQQDTGTPDTAEVDTTNGSIGKGVKNAAVDYRAV